MYGERFFIDFWQYGSEGSDPPPPLKTLLPRSSLCGASAKTSVFKHFCFSKCPWLAGASRTTFSIKFERFCNVQWNKWYTLVVQAFERRTCKRAPNKKNCWKSMEPQLESTTKHKKHKKQWKHGKATKSNWKRTKHKEIKTMKGKQWKAIRSCLALNKLSKMYTYIHAYIHTYIQ